MSLPENNGYKPTLSRYMFPHRHHGIRADTDLGSIRNILWFPATTRPAIYRLVNRLTCGVDAWHALRTSPDALARGY